MAIPPLDAESWAEPALDAYRLTSLIPNEPLPEATVAELVRQAQRGEAAARDELVAHLQRLVFSVALSYARRSRSALLDLVQEANLGLLHALRKYTVGHQTAFTTYAVLWMQHYCLHWLMRDELIVLPLRHHEAQRRVGHIIAELEASGQPVTDAAICAQARLTPEQLQQLRLLPTAISYENQADQEDLTLSGPISWEAANDPPTMTTEVHEALATLEPMERAVVLARAEGGTYEQIAQTLGRCRERVRQIEHRARAKLRARLSDTLSAA